MAILKKFATTVAGVALTYSSTVQNLNSLVKAINDDPNADVSVESEDVPDDDLGIPDIDEEGDGTTGANGEKKDNGQILTLTKDNFQETLSRKKFLLIKWYAPWCGHCKNMAGDYVKASNLLKEGIDSGDIVPDGADKNSVALAEVDATVESELASTYDVQGYPTLHWFVNGQKKLDYTGPRTSDGIVDWIKENVGPALKVISKEESEKLIAERKYGNALIVFSGKDSDQDLVKVASEVAELPLVAAHTVLVKSDSLEKATLTIYRGTDETKSYPSNEEIIGSGDSNDALIKWVSEERRPLFGQINEDNFELYMEHAKEGLFWVCIDPKKIATDLKLYSDGLVKAASEQKEGNVYPFVWLDVSEFEEHAKQELGCTTYPTIVLQRGDLLGERGDSKVDKFIRSFSDKPEDLAHPDTIKNFFEDIESGKLEAVVEPDELDGLDEEEYGEEEGGDEKDDL